MKQNKYKIINFLVLFGCLYNKCYVHYAERVMKNFIYIQFLSLHLRGIGKTM